MPTQADANRLMDRLSTAVRIAASDILQLGRVAEEGTLFRELLERFQKLQAAFSRVMYFYVAHLPSGGRQRQALSRVQWQHLFWCEGFDDQGHSVAYPSGAYDAFMLWNMMRDGMGDGVRDLERISFDELASDPQLERFLEHEKEIQEAGQYCVTKWIGLDFERWAALATQQNDRSLCPCSANGNPVQLEGYDIHGVRAFRTVNGRKLLDLLDIWCQWKWKLMSSVLKMDPATC